MEYILKNYIEVSKNEPIAKNQLAFFIRNELPNYFSKYLIDSNKYFIRGSAGIGCWAHIPWIGFLNKDISSTFKEEYYVAYLFKEDMSGFYLSLMFGFDQFRYYDKKVFYQTSEDLRKIIIACFPQFRNYSPMKLSKKNSNSHVASSYEKADIFSIEYSINDLPSEHQLKNDLSFFLKIYDIIYENKFIDVLMEKNRFSSKNSENDFNNYFNEYLNEKIKDFNNSPLYKKSNYYVKNLVGKESIGYYDNFQGILRNIRNKWYHGFSISYKNTVNSPNKKTEKNMDKVYANNQKNSNSDTIPSIVSSSAFNILVLDLFKDGKNHYNTEIVEKIGKILLDDELSENVEDLVLISIEYLSDEGYLKNVGPGWNCITENGKKHLEKEINSSNRKILKYYIKYDENYFKDNKIDDITQSRHNQVNSKNKIFLENNGSEKKSVGEHDKIIIYDLESNPNKYYNFKKHSNKFKKLSDLLSDENVEKLDEIDYFEENQFDTIIENIINAHKKSLKELIKKNNINFEKLNILEKMFLFSKSFVKTYNKPISDLGYYKFNEIYIDEREGITYKKIRTIIHELSHFLLSEILEQVLSEILNTDKTDILEAFICYTLTDVNDFYLMDEYCACTVEGRFLQRGHQDYTSFRESLIKKHNFTDEDLSIYGNTFAQYIILIMESFMDKSLIDEIREEGLEISNPNNDIEFETDAYLEWEDFKDIIGLILKDRSIYDRFEADTIFEYSMEIRNNNN